MLPFIDVLAAASKLVDGHERAVFSVDRDAAGRRSVGTLQVYQCREDRPAAQYERAVRVFRWMSRPPVEDNYDGAMRLMPTDHYFLNVMITDWGTVPRACVSVLAHCPDGGPEAWGKLTRVRAAIAAAGLCRVQPTEEGDRNYVAAWRKTYGK